MGVCKCVLEPVIIIIITTIMNVKGCGIAH